LDAGSDVALELARLVSAEFGGPVGLGGGYREKVSIRMLRVHRLPAGQNVEGACDQARRELTGRMIVSEVNLDSRIASAEVGMDGID
jgi:hypothetical protein